MPLTLNPSIGAWYVVVVSVDSIVPELFGAWRFVTIQFREHEQDAWLDQIGPDPRGVIIYDASGVLSMHVFGGAHAPRYAGYFGTFRVRTADRAADVVRGVVEHHIEIASEQLGEDVDRPFELSGDRLTIGDGRTWRRVLDRVSPDPRSG